MLFPLARVELFNSPIFDSRFNDPGRGCAVLFFDSESIARAGVRP